MAKKTKAEEPVAEETETKRGRAPKIIELADGTLDYSAHKDAEPTDLQTRFAAWLKDKLELTFKNKGEEAAFDEGVRLGVSLRIPFQASPENQQHRQNAAEEREERAEERKAKPAKEEKPKGKAAKAAPKADPEDEADAPAVASTKAAKPTKRAARSGSKAAPY